MNVSVFGEKSVPPIKKWKPPCDKLIQIILNRQIQISTTHPQNVHLLVMLEVTFNPKATTADLCAVVIVTFFTVLWLNYISITKLPKHGAMKANKGFNHLRT